MIKHIIFDWSGTLCDDWEFTYQITNQTIQFFNGPAITPEIYQNEFKIPVDMFYEKYCPETSIQEIDKHFFKLYQNNIQQLQLFKRVNLILNLINEFQLNAYICSTLDQNILESALESMKLRKYFKEVWGNCFNKEVFLCDKIKTLNIIGDETIFIGDTTHDISAAKSAGIRSGAALYGYHTKEKLLSNYPDHSFNQLSDLFFFLSDQLSTTNKNKPIATVGGLIFNENNEALFVKTQKWSNKYGIPGGKIEHNEKMIDAFIREIKEETNLDISDIELITIQDCIQSTEFYLPKHFLLINYKAKALHTNVLLNYESQEYVWKSLKDALQLNLNQPTRTLIEKLL